MRIKTSITVVIITTTFLVITSLGVTFYHAGKVDQAKEAGRLTDDLVETISRLRFLTYEFQRYHSLRVQEQWQGVYRQVGQQVELAQRLGGEYDLVKHLPTHYRAVGELFDKLLKTSEAIKASPQNNILVELRIKLTGLLFLELQDMMSRITALTTDIREEEAKMEKQVKIVNLSAWSILFLTVVINAFILRRKIVRPLSHLEQGVGIIGAGNLDYRVGTTAPDEVGDLSRAFDAMAVNLQEKTASLEWTEESNATLAETSRQFLEKDPGEVFLDDFSHLVLEQARSLTGSELGYVGYLDQVTGFLICPTLTRNIWETCQVADKTVVFKEFRGLWGWSLDNRQAVLTNDPGSDPRAAAPPRGILPSIVFWRSRPCRGTD
jgi:HAMP domain-containing protein